VNAPLANTGFSAALPLGLAAVLLLGGTAALVVGRRRRAAAGTDQAG
jgi:LPXTG-motif cell wall-anchored protein